ncbi:MAG: Adenylate cyclase 2 [SAR92 bacterium MED-G29]|jgi:class 3 adenylate cyclase|nr:MAG: Adenylate cyclase 2 [SAR92 bacterium MED-G29]|tara:strand:- start:2949 stop:3980 length:1032 start_codon:yes stop_codon:yes gene_type:complete
MANNDAIFRTEDTFISEAKALLSDDGSALSTDQYQRLVTEYEHLLKTTKRLVKLNDRGADRLNELARETQEKNAQLERLSNQLAKYLSPQVYQSIFSGDQTVSLASSRKKLTVFFSDLVGFTSITDSLESEDLTDALNYYLDEMSAIALEYGATIDKYIGDAIMIFFGDPESHGVQEDAIRCVSMAIAMQRRMEELSNRWADYGLHEPFRMRIGINTAYCTVGNFGSEHRLDYTVIGGGVNVASRLETAAKASNILMSEDTYNLVRDSILCREADLITMKGFANPIRTFEVLDQSRAEETISVDADKSHLRVRVAALSKIEIEQLKESLEIALQKVQDHIQNR